MGRDGWYPATPGLLSGLGVMAHKLDLTSANSKDYLAEHLCRLCGLEVVCIIPGNAM